MRSKSVSAVVLASVTLFLVALRAAPAQAGDSSKEKEVGADGIHNTLQWEDKVVGPNNDKKIDHAKIAALQEQARRDEAAKPKVAPSRKPVRPQGVSAPASSTLPTMDIEKAAPAGSVKLPAKKSAAHAEAPKSHDAIDDFLAVNGGDHPATTTVASNTGRADKSRARGGKHARRTRIR
jgi:hypothetical protein